MTDTDSPTSPFLPIEKRVEQSLTRLGYTDIRVEHVGDGKISLKGSVSSHDDRAIAIAATRSVIGVSAVLCELTH